MVNAYIYHTSTHTYIYLIVFKYVNHFNHFERKISDTIQYIGGTNTNTWVNIYLNSI